MSRVEPRRRGRRWIAEEIAGLDPATDSAQIMLLNATRLLPRYGGAMLFNLLYCLGFLRISGQIEGALAVDRSGTGKVHRDGDRRADDTVSYFVTWIQHGPGSEQGVASLKRVKRMHDYYAREYSISNETMVHTIALFTVQFEHLLRLLGAKEGYSRIEEEAHVVHWRQVGEQLGIRDMPETWEGMERVLKWYEGSPVWFGPTPEGKRCADALIAQFSHRWLPPGLHWTGRLLLLSLVEDHVLGVIGHEKPPRPIVWLVHRLIRTGLTINRWLFSDPQELVEPSTLLRPRGGEVQPA